MLLDTIKNQKKFNRNKAVSEGGFAGSTPFEINQKKFLNILKDYSFIFFTELNKFVKKN